MGSWTRAGHPRRTAETVFEPFTPPSPLARAPVSGLSLAYKIIEDHNGTLTIVRRPDSARVWSSPAPSGNRTLCTTCSSLKTNR